MEILYDSEIKCYDVLTNVTGVISRRYVCNCSDVLYVRTLKIKKTCWELYSYQALKEEIQCTLRMTPVLFEP